MCFGYNWDWGPGMARPGVFFYDMKRVMTVWTDGNHTNTPTCFLPPSCSWFLFFFLPPPLVERCHDTLSRFSPFLYPARARTREASINPDLDPIPIINQTFLLFCKTLAAPREFWDNIASVHAERMCVRVCECVSALTCVCCGGLLSPPVCRRRLCTILSFIPDDTTLLCCFRR